jgi:hypothetical protein
MLEGFADSASFPYPVIFQVPIVQMKNWRSSAALYEDVHPKKMYTWTCCILYTCEEEVH